MKTTDKQKPARSTFAVLFFLNTSKPNREGLCPVICRVSVDGEQRAFSIKQTCTPALWNPQAGRARGKSREANGINHAIDAARKEIVAIYERYLMSRGYVSAELIVNTAKGVGCRQTTLLALFDEHNREYEKRVGVDRDRESLNCYERTRREVAGYIRLRSGRHEGEEFVDIPLSELKKEFIEGFEFFLRTDKRRGKKNILNHSTYLKKIVRLAVSQGTIHFDPFGSHIPEQPKSKPRHHRADELEHIMTTPITDDKTRFVRDLFLFSTFTGLAHIDLRNLSGEHLRHEAGGSTWIHIKRQKTGVESNVKLLPQAIAIMEKYRNRRTGADSRIFDVPGRSMMCHYFRKLEKLCNVPLITFHMARHNFATHITLSQGMPLVTVSRMMGHTSIQTTQIYAKIVGSKLKEDMTALGARIGGKYTSTAGVAAIPDIGIMEVAVQ
ncbi:MAG: site-specific integrase [Rikenellaceae bacterium]|jgi:integrase|nr:site-specific integrase [Rikenellaceae bacterium]